MQPQTKDLFALARHASKGTIFTNEGTLGEFIQVQLNV